jgi:hypothetical protein
VSKEPEHTERSESGQPPRRPYVSPELVEYGSVAKLTQTGGMTSTDFFFNLRRMGM